MFRAKKRFSQNFLKNPSTAKRIVSVLSGYDNYTQLLEIGPGTGSLTTFLVPLEYNVCVVEIDPEALQYLRNRFTKQSVSYIEQNVLNMSFRQDLSRSFGLISSLPYHIASPILFKILDNYKQIPEAVLLLQEEMAQRIASSPKSKTYGLLSVLVQAYYEVKYCFKVPATDFSPRPKVDSGLLHLLRRKKNLIDQASEENFRKIVKMAFGQRRKILKNALSGLNRSLPAKYAYARAEQLSVKDFICLTHYIYS